MITYSSRARLAAALCLVSLLPAFAYSAPILVASATAQPSHDHVANDQAAGPVQFGALEITASFTRATLPNAPTGGGYMTIANHGREADRLLSATSPAASVVEIHRMSVENDVMRMQALPDGVEIPPGGTVTLAPGGLHLMFISLAQPFVEGETIPVTLTFEKAGTVDVELPVAGIAADAPTPAPHATHGVGHH